jgi:hypothetical protein
MEDVKGVGGEQFLIQIEMQRVRQEEDIRQQTTENRVQRVRCFGGEEGGEYCSYRV